MILDHNHKYIFISVPKTGSISVQFSLGHGNDIPEPDLYHQGIAKVLTDHPECTNYFKFAFVRNPWARLISLYKDFTVKRVYQYSGLVRHDKPLFSEFSDFPDFCLRVKDSPWWNNVFLRSQTEQLSIDGELKIDFVGRFERLQDDFNEICQRIGVTTSLLKMNVGEYDSTSYRKYYTDETREAVGSLYAEDIKRFNYEF